MPDPAQVRMKRWRDPRQAGMRTACLTWSISFRHCAMPGTRLAMTGLKTPLAHEMIGAP